MENNCTWEYLFQVIAKMTPEDRARKIVVADGYYEGCWHVFIRNTRHLHSAHLVHDERSYMHQIPGSEDES